MSNDVTRHVEQFLGPPRVSYTEDFERQGSITISLHPDEPCVGAVTFVSSGLADHGGIGQELLFSIWEIQFDDDVLELFAALLLHRLQHHAGLRLGEVLPPAGPILDRSPMEAFYVMEPRYFPEEFGRVGRQEDTIRIRWLAPIHVEEAEWIERHGVVPFDELLVAQDPDLLDMLRPPVQLP